jgi:hypothetical protein
MGKYHLNLSTRPFPAYRIASTVMFAIFILLAAISAGQAYGYIHYSEEANAIRGTERDLRAETGRLEGQEKGLRSQLGGSLANARLAEVKYINSLIERRNFCWTCLLRHIETRIPINVHLTSLKPELAKDGTIILGINAQGRSLSDLAEFIDRLQQSEVFEKVNVAVETHGPESHSIVMSVPYHPKRDPSLAAASERKGD